MEKLRYNSNSATQILFHSSFLNNKKLFKLKILMNSCGIFIIPYLPIIKNPLIQINYILLIFKFYH